MARVFWPVQPMLINDSGHSRLPDRTWLKKKSALEHHRSTCSSEPSARG